MTQQTSPATSLSAVISGLGAENLFLALLIAMVGFLAPFVFVYNPAILLEGSAVPHQPPSSSPP